MLNAARVAPTRAVLESQGTGMCVKKSWGVTHANKPPSAAEQTHRRVNLETNAAVAEIG